MSSEDEKLYDQDCQFYRHQDQLMWGRFQTAAVVEGAILYGLYQLTNLGTCERRLLLGAGALLVLAICLLSLKDRSDAKRHLDRISTFEAYKPLPKGRWPRHSGSWLMLLAILVLNATNLLLFYLKW